jgi:hypothetical protein
MNEDSGWFWSRVLSMSSFIDRSWRRGIVVLLLLDVAVIAAVTGLELRRWAWDFSQGAHFKGDVSNAFHWGAYAENNGLFAVYDDNAEDNADDNAGPAPVNPAARMQQRKIDYPPLRLTAAWLWYRWAHQRYPDAENWIDSYDFTRPLLASNTIAEGISAVLIFFIVWSWRRRDARISKESGPWARALCGVVAGTVGAMLLWFNPAVIWDGHCWPQWDIWPVPCFLAAVLLTGADWWFAAGICLAIGASLKGQILLGAPILLIWPIFGGYFDAALRLFSGFLLATVLIALPWMQCSPAAYRWLAMAAAAMLCMMPFVLRWRKLHPRILLAIGAIAAVILAWPWGAHDVNRIIVAAGVAAGVALLALLRFVSARMKLAATCLIASGVILAVMPLFQASSNWYELGFKYGTEKFDFMLVGNGAYNVPRMLQMYWRWSPQTTEDVKLPFVNESVTFTHLMRIIYFITLLLCGVGAAMHQRRRDARFLVAIVAPWLLFFMILTQMHGRYDIWAAAICPLLAGAGMGLAFLGVIVSIVACMGIIHNQLLFSRDWSPDTLQWLNHVDPAPGLLLLLIAGILLYLAVVPRGRRDGMEK